MAKPSDKSLPPTVAEARRKLDQGDVKAARALARQALATDGAGPGADEARAVLERTELPKVAYLLLGLGALFILAMALLGAYRT